MKILRGDIKNLVVTKNLVDIVIQVPIETGQELVDDYQNGIQVFRLTPEEPAAAPAPSAADAIETLKKTPGRKRVAK